MRPGLVRGLMVCVAGMQAFCILIALFLPFVGSLAPIRKAGYGDFPAVDSINWGTLMSLVLGFAIVMSAQNRFRTHPMAVWVLPALFVLGIAICATVGWLAFLWADEINAFLFSLFGAR